MEKPTNRFLRLLNPSAIGHLAIACCYVGEAHEAHNVRYLIIAGLYGLLGVLAWFRKGH